MYYLYIKKHNSMYIWFLSLELKIITKPEKQWTKFKVSIKHYLISCYTITYSALGTRKQCDGNRIQDRSN